MATGDTLGVVMQSDVGASGGVAHQAVEPSLAPEFSASGTYAAGDFVMKEGVLYICSTAHTTAAWDASHFTAVNVGMYLKMVYAANAVANKGVAPGGWLTTDYIELPADSTESTLDSALNTVLNGLSNQTWVSFDIYCRTAAVLAGARWCCYLYRLSQDYATAMFYSYAGIQQKIRFAGTWSQSEWINPPLYAGNEYRTTERFLNKPVYQKVISGTVTAGNVSAGYIGGNIVNATKIFQLCGYYTRTSNGSIYSMPYASEDGTMNCIPVSLNSYWRIKFSTGDSLLAEGNTYNLIAKYLKD